MLRAAERCVRVLAGDVLVDQVEQNRLLSVPPETIL